MVEYEHTKMAGRAMAPGRRGEASDRDLMSAARKGSVDAAEALVERHWDRAHRIAYGILGDAHAAEDVTQDAMLSLLGGIGRFDSRRPFAPWLHRIVANRALDWERARGRRPIPAPVVETASPERGPDPALRAALDELDPEQRALVILRYVGGYGPGEIGRVLKLKRGTVGSRLRRALDRLREEMGEGDG